MEANSPKDFVERLLPQRFDPAKATGVNVVVQVTVTGDSGGNWVVTVKDQKLDVKAGTDASPTLQIKMSDKDFMDLINKKLSPQKAFFSGKLQLKGNIGLAMKLADAGFF